MSNKTIRITIAFIFLCMLRVQAQGIYDQTAINYAPSAVCKGQKFFVKTTFNKGCNDGNYYAGSYGIEWLDVNTNTWLEYGNPGCKLIYVDSSYPYEDQNIIKTIDTLYFDPSLSGVQYIRASIRCNIADGFSGPPVAIRLKDVPGVPEKIIGRAQVGLYANPAYVVKPVPRATSYKWSVTPNLTITEGQDTRSIRVVLSGNYGIISVSAQNECGCSEPVNKKVSIAGNLIENPSFDSTSADCASGFTSDYNCSTDLFPEGNYYVGPKASAYHRDFVGTDKIGNDGNFMIVNGATTAGLDVWRQDVPVSKNTYYVFQFWLSNLVERDPANLQLYINNTLIKDSIMAPEKTNVWQQVSVVWYSGNYTQADLVIRDQSTIAAGNDFGIDEIYFGVHYPNVGLSVHNDEPANMLYPNPVKRTSDQATNFTLEESGEVYIKVTDLVGNLIYQERMIGEKGANVLNFQAQDYKRGTYIVSIQKGATVQRHRLVIED